MVDEETLSHLVDAARLSTPELENICQSVLGVSVSSISNASTPAQQARDMVVYAGQYGLLRQVAAAIIERGSDRAGLQNLLLGNDMDNTRTQNIALDLVKLESRVERMFDKLDAKLDAAILEMRHMRAESATHQPISLSGRALMFVIVALAALVVGQISLLAWVGALPHG
jgi:hypothetical protein